MTLFQSLYFSVFICIFILHLSFLLPVQQIRCLKSELECHLNQKPLFQLSGKSPYLELQSLHGPAAREMHPRASFAVKLLIS
jgi:hypothetical protein